MDLDILFQSCLKYFYVLLHQRYHLTPSNCLSLQTEPALDQRKFYLDFVTSSKEEQYVYEKFFASRERWGNLCLKLKPNFWIWIYCSKAVWNILCFITSEIPSHPIKLPFFTNWTSFRSTEILFRFCHQLQRRTVRLWKILRFTRKMR